MNNEENLVAPLKNYDKIIPTAWLTAYPKIFTDIPLSEDIFIALEKIKAKKGEPDITSDFKVSKLAPEIEARYKLITRILKETNIKQALELAAGLSPRGIIFAKDPSFIYVETDLPKMIIEKKAIIQQLVSSSKVKSMNKLYLEKGNALELKELMRASSHFERKPIVIINEGLLRYLNFTEKGIVAKNIHKLLEIYGGVWITPDITLKKLLDTQNKTTMPGKNAEIIKKTGIDYTENRFENEAEAKKFFESFGFLVEKHRFLEVEKELTSPKRLKLSEKEVKEMIKSSAVFVMKIK